MESYKFRWIFMTKKTQKKVINEEKLKGKKLIHKKNSTPKEKQEAAKRNSRHVTRRGGCVWALGQQGSTRGVRTRRTRWRNMAALVRGLASLFGQRSANRCVAHPWGDGICVYFLNKTRISASSFTSIFCVVSDPSFRR